MAKKLWGARFKKDTDKDFEEFSKSIQYDYKLAQYDIYHSIIHVNALVDSSILTKDEGSRLISVLRQILREIEEGEFKPDLECEDIHSDIQNRVEKKAPKLAAKLHTLRSRNDQIVFDEKVYCLNEVEELGKLLTHTFDAIIGKASQYEKNFFLGYTHTRRAQVIFFNDYILAYAHMFKRDYRRLQCFIENLGVSIGSGALAGSSLNAKHYQKVVFSALVKKHLAELENAVDNVSSRDFIIELLNTLAILQMHLSRLAEDMIMYSGKEFEFLELPEEFCTGSSLMPHKKNPDFLELVRGYSGIIYGNLMAILTTMKGLPLTYNRDMQLDKTPLFSSVEIVKKELKIMAEFIKGITLKEKNIAKALEDECLYATEIAEFLVTEKNIPFSQAHDAVGRLIRYAQEKELKIQNMQDSVLKTFHPDLDSGALRLIMNPEHATSSKRSILRKVPKIKNNKLR
ncbi:MAG: argininosuccinate lyase [Candidatus Omnitrophota bacterium]|nr:MAG: argininosuccinate lyase [Candidatus Omnitrophota bacterium]